MELHFVSPELAALDQLEGEVLACTVWCDQRPASGVASLCDWRLAGRISRLLRGGFLEGNCGEVMMVPGRPKLPFEKILLFGAGARGDFDDVVYRQVMGRMLETIAGLGVRLAVVELPGRQSQHIEPERAADMLLEATATDPEHCHDVWTLVEDGEARRRIQKHMVEERRRIRREL